MHGLHCALTGRVGGDPERKYTQAGKMMLTFRVAVDESSTATEQRAAPETTWLKITIWEEKAEELEGVLKKGMSVYVEGRLKLDRWTAPDGQQRSALSLSAWTVQPMGQIRRRRPERGAESGPPTQQLAAVGAELEELPF